jgi:hypothetical protein
LPALRRFAPLRARLRCSFRICFDLNRADGEDTEEEGDAPAQPRARAGRASPCGARRRVRVRARGQDPGGPAHPTKGASCRYPRHVPDPDARLFCIAAGPGRGGPPLGVRRGREPDPERPRDAPAAAGQERRRRADHASLGHRGRGRRRGRRRAPVCLITLWSPARSSCARRNLCVDGGHELCGEMYNKNVLAPLRMFIPKVRMCLR